ncbi:hypothetical protein J7E81_11350 [Bacillus sp. ISL-18]|uniref:hypothetical protein n=1 Tax=Bacillus sp. ISL-18 TaxID=2819118 RepID=UPI001BEC7AFC|nr:hypothetical protein [Bacillus sp. ISL-18]MBT2655823.1 hypothetical protein [Bacillus sp. ISL-18]
MTTAHQMPRSVLVAMQNAVSRKGVSVLVLPGDVAGYEADDTPVPEHVLHCPVLVDVIVNCQELSFPPKITFEQAHGFSLWMMKAVLNGRGNELLLILPKRILSANKPGIIFIRISVMKSLCWVLEFKRVRLLRQPFSYSTNVL